MGVNILDEHNYNGGFSNNMDSEEVVSVIAWIGISIILMIPIINIIIMLYLAMAPGNKNIMNFARASLIMIILPMTFILLAKACR